MSMSNPIHLGNQKTPVQIHRDQAGDDDSQTPQNGQDEQDRIDPPCLWHIRLAQTSDIPVLHALIEASIRGLQTDDYTPAQIEGAIGTVLGLDTQLIRDQTYYLAETTDSQIAGCGGWSKRKTLFGADGASVREAGLLDPATNPDAAAKIRAIFVHPTFARRGLGSLVLAHVEAAAQSGGFCRFEMGSTLTGVPLYTLKGYKAIEQIAVPLSNGETLPIVKMIKIP